MVPSEEVASWLRLARDCVHRWCPPRYRDDVLGDVMVCLLETARCGGGVRNAPAFIARMVSRLAGRHRRHDQRQAITPPEQLDARIKAERHVVTDCPFEVLLASGLLKTWLQRHIVESRILPLSREEIAADLKMSVGEVNRALLRLADQVRRAQLR